MVEFVDEIGLVPTVPIRARMNEGPDRVWSGLIGRGVESPPAHASM